MQTNFFKVENVVEINEAVCSVTSLSLEKEKLLRNVLLLNFAGE